jgi:hypothetical protein
MVFVSLTQGTLEISFFLAEAKPDRKRVFIYPRDVSGARLCSKFQTEKLATLAAVKQCLIFLAAASTTGAKFNGSIGGLFFIYWVPIRFFTFQKNRGTIDPFFRAGLPSHLGSSPGSFILVFRIRACILRVVAKASLTRRGDVGKGRPKAPTKKEKLKSTRGKTKVRTFRDKFRAGGSSHLALQNSLGSRYQSIQVV